MTRDRDKWSATCPQHPLPPTTTTTITKMLLLPHTKGKILLDPGAGLGPFKQGTISEPQPVTSHPVPTKLSQHTTKFILIFKFVNMKFHWELIMM
jgi:hypothetical protein